AWSERRNLAALAAHLSGAVEDHEELVAVVAFLHDRGARRDPPVLRPVRQRLQILARTGGEECDLLEVIDEDVVTSHGRKLSAAMRAAVGALGGARRFQCAGHARVTSEATTPAARPSADRSARRPERRATGEAGRSCNRRRSSSLRCTARRCEPSCSE